MIDDLSEFENNLKKNPDIKKGFSKISSIEY